MNLSFCLVNIKEPTIFKLIVTVQDQCHLVTAGTSFACGAIFAAFGAALGWICGGSIARSCIQSDKSIEVWIPFRKKDIYIV